MVSTQEIKNSLQEALNEMGFDSWKLLERNGKALRFDTVQERVDYEYRRCTSTPRISTAEERNNAWKYLRRGLEEDQVSGVVDGPLGFVVNWMDVSPEEFSSSMGPAIEQGQNIEGAIRQAYAFLQIAEEKQRSGNAQEANEAQKIINLLEGLISNIKSNEQKSPYYQVKEALIRAQELREQIEKEGQNSKNYAELNQKLQEEEKFVNDFINNCQQKGMDKKIVEQYVADCRANLATEKARGPQAQKANATEKRPPARQIDV